MDDGGAERQPVDAAPAILLVDDEQLLREIISAGLEAGGAAVTAVASGDEALTALDTCSFDVVLLDVGLPGISGFETLQALRARGHDVPVIMITAAGSLDSRVAGFDLGADDYVLKPVLIPELQRRVTAILRRAHGPKRFGQQLLGPSRLALDLSARTAHVGTTEVALTPKQFELLQLLLETRGSVVDPERISQSVWGYGTLGSRNFIEAQVSRIRARLADAGATDVIATIRGVGYVIR